jgi:hypothetical protein
VKDLLMIDPEAVLDRFGDEEFLRELWLRAREQLPAEMAGIEQAAGHSVSEVGKRLHKLRGLIANFLEGGQAIAQLRLCEEQCRQQGEFPVETWSQFCQTLDQEASQLEGWLTGRGFPCR